MIKTDSNAGLNKQDNSEDTSKHCQGPSFVRIVGNKDGIAAAIKEARLIHCERSSSEYAPKAHSPSAQLSQAWRERVAETDGAAGL